MELKLTPYKGTRDIYPDDMDIRNYLFASWRKVVLSYGYREYMAPMLEPVELYMAKSSQEIVSEQTYSFSDRGGRNMVIRPEMTPSIARMVAARRQETPLPARYFSIANFMRYERPQHGREREFWQLNFDLFGDDSVQADVEIISLSKELLSSLGVSDDMYTIKVNDRRLTDTIMSDYLGLAEGQKIAAIRLLDKYDKLSNQRFRELALEIMDELTLDKLEGIISVNSINDLPDSVAESEPAKGLANLLNKLVSLSIKNVIYDVRLMRGFDYYTGTVFEVFDNNPDNQRAIFGGGRYDKLIEQFGVESLPVVGAAVGETMMIEFLRTHQLIPIDKLGNNRLVDLVTLDNSDEVINYAMTVSDKLRSHNYDVATDFTNRKLDKKLRAAVKRGAKAVAFVGPDELANNQLSIRLLDSQTTNSYSIKDELDDIL